MNNAVNQVGESLASTASSRRSEQNDSERGSVTGSIDTSPISEPPPPHGPALIDLSSPGNGTSDNKELLGVNTSSLMEGSDEGPATPVRQRRDSWGSIGSMDSITPNFFPAYNAPAQHRLNTIASDVESVATDLESNAGSSYLSGASKEQISTVLHKLQGRAASYKDKYRELVKAYNDIVRENEKCRTVLATTQDKALRRIDRLQEERKQSQKHMRDLEEQLRLKLQHQDNAILLLRENIQLAQEGKPLKDEAKLADAVPVGAQAAELTAEREKRKRLEDLLNRCKESIKTNKDKIQQLTNENEQLKQNMTTDEGDAGISELVAERQSMEAKQRLDEERIVWEGKLTEAEEKTALALAEAKQEMHIELERKDEHLQQLMQKVRLLESEVAEAREKTRNQEEAVTAATEALEKEKQELVERLSQTKQEAVSLVKSEGEKERVKQLEVKDNEWKQKLSDLQQQFASQRTDIEEEWKGRVKEIEEQMQLAIEEREMQKVAAVTEIDQKRDQLHCALEEMKTEKLQLESEINRLKDYKETDVKQLTQIIEENSKRHKIELEEKRRDEEEGEMGRQKELEEKATEAQKLAETKLESLQKELEAATQGYQTDIAEKITELNSIQDKLEVLSSEKETLELNLRNLELQTTDHLSALKKQEQDHADETAKLGSQITELNEKLKRGEEEMGRAERESGELDVKLAETRNRVGELEERLTRKEKEVEEWRGNYSELENDLRAKEQQFQDKLEELMSEKSVEVSEFRRQVEDLNKAEVNRLEMELKRATKDHEDKETLSKKDLIQAIDKLGRTEETLAQRTLECNDTVQKLQESQSKTKTLEEEIGSLEGLKESALHRQQLRVKELGDILWTLSNSAGAFRDQLGSFGQETEAELSDKLSDLEKAVENYRTTLQSEAGVQLDNAEGRMNMLKEKLLAFLRSTSFLLAQKEEQLTEHKERVGVVEEAMEAYKSQLEGKEEEGESVKQSAKETQQQLEEQLGTLEQQLQESHGEISRLSLQNESMKKQVEDVERRNEFVEKEKQLQIKELHELLGVLEDAVSVYRKELKSRDEERAKMLAEMKTEERKAFFERTESEQEMNRLADRVSELEEAIEVYKSSFGANKGQISELSESVKEKESELGSVRGRVNALLKDGFFALQEKESQLMEERKRVDELEEAVEVFKERLKEGQEELKVVREELETKSDSLSALQDKVTQFEQTNTSSAQEFQHLKTALELKEKNVQELSSELSIFKDTVIHLQQDTEGKEMQLLSKLKSLENELSEKQTLVLSLQEQLDSQTTGHSTRLGEKDAQISEITSRLQNSEKICQDLTEELNSLRNELHTAKEQYTLVVTHRASLDTKIMKEEKVVMELREELEKRATRCSEIQVIHETTLVEMESIKSELESLKLTLKETEEKFSKERQNLQEEAETKVGEYKKKAESKLGQIKKQAEKEREGERGKLEGRMEELEREMGEREAKIGELSSLNQRHVTEIQSSQQVWEKERGELEARLREVEESLAKVEGERDRVGVEVEGLRVEVVDKNQKLMEKTLEMDTLTRETQISLKNEEDLESQAVEKAREEFQNKLQTLIEEHNEKVKTMAIEFDAQMQEKEAEYQQEIKTTYKQLEEDRNRTTREYQKEVKNLYRDLNEKNQQLRDLTTKYDKDFEAKGKEVEGLRKSVETLESQSKVAKTALHLQEKKHKEELDGFQEEWSHHEKLIPVGEPPANTENQSGKELEKQAQIAHGELLSGGPESIPYLQQRVRQLETSVETLKEKHRKELEMLTRGAMDQFSSSDILRNVPLESFPASPLFTEPTEAEYLRNVLYRYMTERETLGKECVTLARVIATVLKFNGDQTDRVVSKEEHRLHSWYGT